MLELSKNPMDLLIEFAKIGLGVGCVIREFVKEDLALGQLIELPLDHPITKRTIGFAYNEASSSRALRSFLEFTQEGQNIKQQTTAHPKNGKQ